MMIRNIAISIAAHCLILTISPPQTHAIPAHDSTQDEGDIVLPEAYFVRKIEIADIQLQGYVPKFPNSERCSFWSQYISEANTRLTSGRLTPSAIPTTVETLMKLHYFMFQKDPGPSTFTLTIDRFLQSSRMP